MAMISLKDVSKVYEEGARPALSHINLEINHGEFVFLVGASGSGKTTLLQLLLREQEATSGEIHVIGEDLRRLPNRLVPRYRRNIGFVFQDYKLLAGKTVWQNIAFALQVIGARRSVIRTRVHQVLATVGLDGKEDRLPSELSGGEAQRVAIARAYVNHPKILLADEPTGNLDPTTSVGIMEVLDSINRTGGTTVVMATHNEEIVNSMKKRVVELHAGELVRDEKKGGYDSARYFPDREVENKARKRTGEDLGEAAGAVHGAQTATVSRPPRPNAAEKRRMQAQEELIDSVGGDPGIARLEQNIHAGHKGRYGRSFRPVEETLTWGTGLTAAELAGTVPKQSGAAGHGHGQQAGTNHRQADQPQSDQGHVNANGPDGERK